MKKSAIEICVAWLQIALGIGMIVMALVVHFHPWVIGVAITVVGVLFVMMGVHILNLSSKTIR